uniref:ensconsin-like isoform X2 n=1 Tax=Pristiophorus japonicus TaxID=55135 RepID=UPI00398ED3E5
MAEAEGVASRVDGGDGAFEAQVKVEDKKGQLSSHSTSTSGQSVNSGTKQDLPVLRVDDKQRLAKERREERQKQLAAREQLLLEKEEKARQHYEKQLEERKKKIEEQRLKEERRRSAVEEKRKQRLQEEKERHEAVVRRTIEKSQRVKQKSNRWSWGGSLQSNATINRDDADRRSVSTMNLTKHADPVISKRLSSSSATLLNSPDRARRLQLSPWESSIVTRLLTPTHSFLARSRSTAVLYGNGQDAVIPICPRSVSASSITSPTCKNLNRMSDWPRFIVTTHDVSGQRRSAHQPKIGKKEKEKENEREKNAVAAFAANATLKRPYSLNVKNKSPMPSTVRSSVKTSTSVVNAKLLTSPPGSVKNSPIQWPTSPGNVRPVKTSECEKKDQEKESLKTEENTNKQLSVSPSTLAVKQPVSVEEPATKPEYKDTIPVILSTTPGKITAGTTDAAEAIKLLAENRRIAREQRDREEEEKREKEERERQMKEEMLRRKSEEKARREGEARRLEEERRFEEEQQKLVEERQLLDEMAQRERFEIERLQKQKEEDARAREDDEKLRIEREKHFQKEEQERMERKKRLEQIMKRTRRSDTSEKKDNEVRTTEQRNGEVSKLATLDEEASIQDPDLTTEAEMMSTVPEEVADEESVIQELGIKGEFVDHSQIDKECPATEKIIKVNGVSVQDESFEDFIDLSLGVRVTRVATETINDDCQDEVGIPVNPLIAFEENGSMELLTKVDGIQTQQIAEVI